MKRSLEDWETTESTYLIILFRLCKREHEEGEDEDKGTGSYEVVA